MELELATVLASTKDAVTTITLNRPEKRNAMSPQLHKDMGEALLTAKHDEETRVVVITGAGESFCAGQDLKEYFHDTENDPVARERARGLSHEWRYRILNHFPKPTIASINGWCFGGAFTIVTSCDIAIAADEAIFGLSEVNWGNIPGGLVAKVVADTMPPRYALYYSMTGAQFDGRRAVEVGLATMSVPKAELAQATSDMADVLKEKNPYTLEAIKQAFKSVDLRTMSAEDAFRWLALIYEELQAKTAKDGVASGVDGIRKFMNKEYRPGAEAMPLS